jgi:hypothetical protein
MSFDDAAQWQRQWLEVYQHQLEAYEQLFAASDRIVVAQRQGLRASQEVVKAQMRWLTLWGL